MRQDARQRDETQPKPLTEPVMFILTSLLDEPRHGYALIQDIARLSHGRVRLTTGTLYGALRRLLEDRWIERFEQSDVTRDKQAYCLTAMGRRHLELEVIRLRQLVNLAGRRLTEREVWR
jgi:DNA-binding PadR family transcriptional regulator